MNDTATEGPTGVNPPAISVRDLEKSYESGDGSIDALTGVSFDIEPGTVVGILGPNGAGKTTLIKCILDLVSPSSGTRKVFGTDVDERPRVLREHVGAMFEGARNVYWRLTVRQNLDFFTRLHGDDPKRLDNRFTTLFEQLDLAEKADTRVRKLSRGQKQKVALATVLSGRKDIVFLDEPTLGLDVESSLELRRELRRLVDQRDLTVVLSSHDMDVIEDLCDRVIIMRDGGIVADASVTDLLNVFETDVYELSLAGDLSGGVERTIRREFDVISRSTASGGTTLRVAVVDANRIHELTGALLDGGVDLERVSTVEQDFERIFLALTDSDSPGASSSRAAVPEGVTSEMVDDA